MTNSNNLSHEDMVNNVVSQLRKAHTQAEKDKIYKSLEDLK